MNQHDVTLSTLSLLPARVLLLNQLRCFFQGAGLTSLQRLLLQDMLHREKCLNLSLFFYLSMLRHVQKIHTILLTPMGFSGRLKYCKHLKSWCYF